MNAQLQALIDDLRSARERLHRLAAAVPEDRWTQRPAPQSWSPAECVAHLNLTSVAFIPGLREAIAKARANGGGPAPARYRHDLLGWLLWRSQKPGGGVKVKTTAAFIPESNVPRAELIAEFDRLQDEQMELVRQGDGLPLSRMKIASPFAPAMKYSVYSALALLPTHQHRHLLQAERAWEAISGAAGGR
ncbi:MAG TPA: DinB family protein [Longimicrobium sp.]|nr:DinB family protein [Longimicrobium sp.]